jgi:hypothetical protein
MLGKFALSTLKAIKPILESDNINDDYRQALIELVNALNKVMRFW